MVALRKPSPTLSDTRSLPFPERAAWRATTARPRLAPRALPFGDARRATRNELALPAWLCADEGSARGYALELSRTGARFGGVGTRLVVGQRVVAKIVVDAASAPLVLMAEVVRYAPATSCPQLCVRFVDVADDEHFRLVAFLAGLAPRG